MALARLDRADHQENRCGFKRRQASGRPRRQALRFESRHLNNFSRCPNPADTAGRIQRCRRGYLRQRNGTRSQSRPPAKFPDQPKVRKAGPVSAEKRPGYMNERISCSPRTTWAPFWTAASIKRMKVAGSFPIQSKRKENVARLDRQLPPWRICCG